MSLRMLVTLTEGLIDTSDGPPVFIPAGARGRVVHVEEGVVVVQFKTAAAANGQEADDTPPTIGKFTVDVDPRKLAFAATEDSKGFF